jgi:hypothetical protein
MQKLDRDGTVHRQMPGAIYFSHPACAQSFLNVILLVERTAYKRIRSG